MAPLLLVCTLVTANPWADAVVAFDQGQGGSPGYDQPNSTLGAPSVMTGQGTQWPTVVSPFAPAWMPDQIVSIGAGGRLTIAFDTPVTDSADNIHGIDLIVFGNAGCVDGAYPMGTCTGFFGGDGGTVLVSQNGSDWIEVPDIEADGPWPTLAWLDAGPYDETPGTISTDPTCGMDPAVLPDDAVGLGWTDLVTLYGTSAGGAGIDLATLGLDAVQYVRIDVDEDAFLAVEIDAVVDAGPWSPCDLNGDGATNVDDLLILLSAWGSNASVADLDNDGIVSVDDLLMLLVAWT